MEDQVVSVSEFVALLNQTLEFAYPKISIEGEVSELRISKNQWVYFNLQDEHSSVKMFGTVYQLQQPIEDGMKVVVRGTPKLHNKYGFSVNISSISPTGEGSIKKAFELLKQKLNEEGLFAPERKRQIPAIPARIGLITSAQAAAYGDFMEIINQRWSGVDILHVDVQVQGEPAPKQIVGAINYFSQMPNPVDVLVITRGGGSSEDLMAFSTESVARAIAGSRIPTVVGVGHEMDVSLADMVADVRAATPTNAAQLVVPDKREVQHNLGSLMARIREKLTDDLRNCLARTSAKIDESLSLQVTTCRNRVENLSQKIELVNPLQILKRGYSLITDSSGATVHSASKLTAGDKLMVRFNKGSADVEVVDAKE